MSERTRRTPPLSPKEKKDAATLVREQLMADSKATVDLIDKLLEGYAEADTASLPRFHPSDV